jgi:hypothetical protein
MVMLVKDIPVEAHPNIAGKARSLICRLHERRVRKKFKSTKDRRKFRAALRLDRLHRHVLADIWRVKMYDAAARIRSLAFDSLKKALADKSTPRRLIDLSFADLRRALRATEAAAGVNSTSAEAIFRAIVAKANTMTATEIQAVAEWR